MGVKGLWSLLGPGKPIDPRELKGKILAVDLSIWLYKALNGYGKFGSTSQQRHEKALQSLFIRVCSLLIIGIRPIFVFDGQPPQIKYEVLKKRKDIRQKASEDRKEARKNLQTNALKMMVLKQFGHEDISDSQIESVLNQLKDDQEDQLLFYSEELKKEELIISESEDEEGTEEFDNDKEDIMHDLVKEQFLNSLIQNEKVDIQNKQFQNLTYTEQLGMLADMKEKDLHRFGRSQLKPFEQSSKTSQEEANIEFGSYQLEGIMARGKMREQIKQIENQRKIDRMGNLLEMDGKCRILGRKSALIDMAKTSQEDVSPEKKMRTIFNDDLSQDSSANTTAEDSTKSSSKLSDNKPIKQSKAISKSKIIEGIIGFENESNQNNITQRPKLQNLDKLFDEPTNVSSDDEFISDNETVDDSVTQNNINPSTGSVEGKMTSGPVEKITISDDEDEDQFMSSSEDESDPTKSITQVDCQSSPNKNVTDRAITLSSSDAEDQVEDHKATFPNTTQEPSSKEIIPLASSLEVSKQKSNTPKTDSSLENLVKQKEAALLARIMKSRKVYSDENTAIDNKHDDETENKPDVKPETQQDVEVKAEKEVKHQTKLETKEGDDPATKPDTQSGTQHHPNFGSDTESKTVDKLEDKSEARSDQSDNKSESNLHASETEPEVEPVFDFKLEALRRENELSRIRLENASKITQAPSSDLYLDAAQLLNLFGAGIMFAPGEAEAQCARLEYDSITEGTITDDSDTFLFGGRRVYRHMTPGKMTPILHSMDNFGYNRNQLIGIAHLTGSDYCTGVNGIGPKTALKIINEFKSPVSPNDFIASIRSFADWWKLHHSTLTSGCEGSKFRLKLKKLKVENDLPNGNATNAYLNPDDEHMSLKKTGLRDIPDVEGLRNFALRKMGWSQQETDYHLMPILKRIQESDSKDKSKISYYFKTKT